jgi:ATP-binding cassette subfamily B protein
VFLTDSNFIENIAFGVVPAKIDLELVRESAKRAQIANYIDDLPEGYNSRVGENGVLLSGGQKQRIGIARALYRCSSVLIFDEATNALDIRTERLVMDSVRRDDTNLTIIIVAHRLQSVSSCDIVLEFGNGKVIGEGTYESLIQESATFRQLAEDRTSN